MKQHKIIVGILAFGISSSFAGTMGPISEYDFNGFYIGLESGILTLLNSFDETTINNGTTTRSVNTNSQTSISFNGNIGYGIVRDQYYLGLKGAVTYSPIFSQYINTESGTGTLVNFQTGAQETLFRDATYQNGHSFQPIYDLDLTLGYELFPHVLPYVEAGVSWTNFRLKNTSTDVLRNISTGATYTSTNSYSLAQYKIGWNVGVGVDYQPHQNWILTTEFSYTGFGSEKVPRQTYTTPPFNSSPTTFWINDNNKALSAMAGLAYLFDY